MKLLLLLFFPFFNLWALVPIESLILGDFSDSYLEKVNDPLNYIFTETLNKEGDHNYFEQLLYYQSFIESGNQLDLYCQDSPRLVYASNWKKTQALRSVIADLQYIGLDIVTRALAQYAKHYEFSESEYRNLVDGLVGNYCSTNLSIISLRQLKKNMLIRYSKESDFKLPSIGGNPYFSDALKAINSKDIALKNEMYYTTHLFKILCSWGNEVDNVRLLVPILRNPQIMSFIIRQMSGNRIEVDGKNAVIQSSSNTVKVYCDNLVCRKKDNREFLEKMPRAIGSSSLQKDLEALYCYELRDIDYEYKDQVPKIKKMINDMTFDDENFSVSQLIALITGVPDFFVRAKSFSDWKKILRSSMDGTFDKWANERSEKFSTEVFYEESITIEKVDRKLFYNEYQGNFKVVFDVNLGEFDRGAQMAGKLSVSFNLELPQTYLAWVRDKWINWDPRNPEERTILQENFKKYITETVQAAREKFQIPPWRGDLERLIVREILEQLNEYRGKDFDQISKQVVQIPVVLNFSPFALKYIRYRYRVQKNIQRAQKNYQ